MTVQHAPCLVFNDVACDGDGVNRCNHLVREKANFGARRRQGSEGRARVKVGYGKLGLVSSVQDQFERLLFLLDAEEGPFPLDLHVDDWRQRGSERSNVSNASNCTQMCDDGLQQGARAQQRHGLWGVQYDRSVPFLLES